MPEQAPTPKPLSPAQDSSLSGTLPYGDPVGEQQRHAQKGLQHHEAKHRRETQETTLLTQEQVDRAASTSAPIRVRSTPDSRARQQVEQASQAEAEGPTVTKKSRGRRGDLEARLRSLTSTLGPDHAQELIEKTEACCQRSHSGLTIPPSEVKQLAKDLAKTLKGRAESATLGAAPSGLPVNEKEITQKITAALIHNREGLEPAHVIDALIPSKESHTPPPHLSVQNLLDAPAARALDAKLSSGAVTTAELATLRANLSPKDLPAFDAGLLKWEVEHEAPALTHVVVNDEAIGIDGQLAVAMFVQKLLPEHRQRMYKEDLAAFVLSDYAKFVEGTTLAQNELLAKISPLRDKLHSLRTNALELHSLLGTRTGKNVLSPEQESHLRLSDPSDENFLSVLLESYDLLVAGGKEILSHPSKYPLADEARLLLERRITQIEEERDVAVRVWESIRAILVQLDQLELALLERRNILWGRYGAVLQECGYIRPRPAQRIDLGEPSRPGVRTEDRGVGDRSFSLIENEKELRPENTSRASEAPTVREDKPTQFELRQKADLERSIAEDHARRYVLAGDFANADAAISAYNNRFPEFQISTSVLSALKEKVTEAETAAQPHTAQA